MIDGETRDDGGWIHASRGESYRDDFVLKARRVGVSGSLISFVAMISMGIRRLGPYYILPLLLYYTSSNAMTFTFLQHFKTVSHT